jgi:hypothetical protein
MYAPPRGDGPICAIYGQTLAAGQSMPIARASKPRLHLQELVPGQRSGRFGLGRFPR